MRRERLRDIALLVAETGRGLAREIRFLEYPATGAHAKEPPVKLWELALGKKAVARLKDSGLLSPILRKRSNGEDIKKAMEIAAKYKKDSVDAVIALSNYSTSHTAFRVILTRALGARYASMPLFDASMLDGAMNVDWRALSKRTRRIAKAISPAERIEVTSPNGTKIQFSKKGRKALCDTGILKRPGSFGNLPAGEVFLAPVEGTAHGRLVLEWAPTRRLASPVVIRVEDGLARDVSGDEQFASTLREAIAARAENANIAELGIGTNDRASRPDNILESEKILGTIHIALGDNSSFGGKVNTPLHQDFVFFKPTVALIDKKGKTTILMKDGKHML